MDWYRRLRVFLADVWVELKKTTWPERKEVYGTTVVVIVTVLICAFYLWIVDLLLSSGMDLLLRGFR